MNRTLLISAPTVMGLLWFGLGCDSISTDGIQAHVIMGFAASAFSFAAALLVRLASGMIGEIKQQK